MTSIMDLTKTFPTFGGLMRHLRRTAKLTQSELSDMTALVTLRQYGTEYRIAQSTISEIESNATVRPQPNVLQRLVEALQDVGVNVQLADLELALDYYTRAADTGSDLRDVRILHRLRTLPDSVRDSAYLAVEAVLQACELAWRLPR